MTRLRHDPLTQALHWLIALAVIATYAIGLIREDLPKGDFRSWLLMLHMSLGFVVAAASVVRIAWRSVAPAPVPLPGTPATRLAAKAGHVALYVTLFAIPLLGLLAAWIKGRGIMIFGVLPLPSPIAVNKDLAENLEELHGLAAHAMMLLAGGHAAIAIVHQFVLKDGTLGRMLPFLRPDPVTTAGATTAGE